MSFYSHKPTRYNEIELLDAIGNIVKKYNVLKYGANNVNDHVKYLPAYPPYVFGTTGDAHKSTTPSKVICYDIIKKEHGSTDANQFSSQKIRRAVDRESIDYPITNDDGTTSIKKATISSLHYDVLLRFDCMCPTDRESLELIRDLELILEVQARYLEIGVKRFLYNGRTPSYFSRDTHYKSRTCTYFTQIEEHFYRIDDRIDNIDLNLTVNQSIL